MPATKADILEAEDPARGINLRVPCFTEIDEEKLRDQLEHDHFFWLDIAEPTEDDIEHLGHVFDFHPLALEDSLHFGQRPKLDDFGDYVFMVFYGAREHREQGDEPLDEVHVFLSGKFLITLHHAPLPALKAQRDRISGRVMHSEQFVVYRVLDALTDTFFPPLAEIDDEIDDLEDGIVQQPTDEHLHRIFALKRDLVAMRKVVTPQRDLLASSFIRDDLSMTLWITLVSVVLVAIVSYVLALYVRFGAGPLPRIVRSLYLIPMFVPVVIAVYAAITFYVDRGGAEELRLCYTAQPAERAPRIAASLARSIGAARSAAPDDRSSVRLV